MSGNSPELTRLRLRDFKAFTAESGGASMSLRPITLIYGFNNSGKSALLRSLVWFDDSLRPGHGQPLHLKSPALLGAGFDALMTAGTHSPIEIEADFNAPNGKNATLSWRIRPLSEILDHVVERFVCTVRSNGDDQPLDSLTLEWTAKSGEQGPAREYQVWSGASESSIVNFEFSGLIPKARGGWNHSNAECNTFLESLESPQAVHWLTSRRAPPPRSFALLGRPDDLSPDGSGYAEALAWYDKFNTQGDPVHAVSQWFEEHLGVRFSLSPNGGFISPVFAARERPAAMFSALESGQGLQEVLPVLALLNLPRPAAAILAIEEPESHLHPRLHAALARECIDAVRRQPGTKVLLETHSENILLAVQIEIAEGTIAPEDVVVHWVQSSPDGTATTTEINFDDLGRPSRPWPDGVFSEDIEQSRRLLEARKRKVS
jgi:predicted ATPase